MLNDADDCRCTDAGGRRHADAGWRDVPMLAIGESDGRGGEEDEGARERAQAEGRQGAVSVGFAAGTVLIKPDEGLDVLVDDERVRRIG
jgi:hypothetical protein